MQEQKLKEKKEGWEESVRRFLTRWVERYLPGMKREELAGRIVRFVGRGLISTLVAYLFAVTEAVGGTKPFGLALLCATGYQTPWILLGVLLAVFGGNGGLITLIAACLAVLLRVTVGFLWEEERKGLFNEPTAIRLAIGAIAGFIVGMYTLFSGGFGKAALGEALFLIGAIPAMTLLYQGAGRKQDGLSLLKEAGELAILYTVVHALVPFTVFGFSPALTVALILTLTTATAGGALRGGLAGMIGGLACGSVYSAMLGLAGVLSGYLKHKGRAVPLLSGSVIAVGCAVLLRGQSAFYTVVPSFMWGLPLTFLMQRSGITGRLGELSIARAPSETTVLSTVLQKRREEEGKRRLEALSTAMSSLSSVFYALSHRLATPGTYELRELCEQSLRDHCAHCRRNGICWGGEYDRTADAINKLALATVQHGLADSSYMPSEFLDACPHVEKVIATVNVSHARLLEQAAERDKIGIFALDYEAMATLLAHATEEGSAEYQLDEAASDRVRRAMAKKGPFCHNVSVYGKRKKTVLAGGFDRKAMSFDVKELQALLEEAVGVKLTTPEFHIDADYISMTASSAKVLSCETARASMRKEEELVNGDSAVVFENREERFYALLSDGMGSGKEAAITSRMTCIILEKLLAAGNRKDIALKMLNNFIRNKNMECFATVDLLEIDLLTGQAAFIKSGAAASYVLREGKLFKIASTSMPIGITREITAEEITFTLRPGDLVVMISDGISQSYEDGVWLLELLSGEIDASSPLPQIAKTVLEGAKQHKGRKDDMTVALTRIA